MLHCLSSQSCSVPVRVSNLGLLEQQDYWRPSASCSSVNYNRVSSLRTVSERKQEQKKSMTNFCCSIYQFLICYFILLLSVKHVLLTLCSPTQQMETPFQPSLRRMYCSVRPLRHCSLGQLYSKHRLLPSRGSPCLSSAATLTMA